MSRDFEAEWYKSNQLVRRLMTERDQLTAALKVLEAHLRRVLEAGKVVRKSTYLPRHSLLELQNWDQAVSDAEGVLRG